MIEESIKYIKGLTFTSEIIKETFQIVSYAKDTENIVKAKVHI